MLKLQKSNWTSSVRPVSGPMNGNETVSVGLKWSVTCQVIKSGCRATFDFGLSVSDGKNGPVSGVRNTPFMGPSVR